MLSNSGKLMRLYLSRQTLNSSSVAEKQKVKTEGRWYSYLSLMKILARVQSPLCKEEINLFRTLGLKMTCYKDPNATENYSEMLLITRL